MNKKNILLVEDDPNFGSILKEYLKINGYQVTLAKNGIEGFEKLICFRKFFFFDVIILKSSLIFFFWEAFKKLIFL